MMSEFNQKGDDKMVSQHARSLNQGSEGLGIRQELEELRQKVLRLEEEAATAQDICSIDRGMAEIDDAIDGLARRISNLESDVAAVFASWRVPA